MVKIVENHILNDDDSFLSPDEIVADLFHKTYDEETKIMILNNFDAPKDVSRDEMFAYAFGRMEFGRWVRNIYGLLSIRNSLII